MNDVSAPSWKVEKDADSVVWLTLDKPNTSANVLSSSVLRELDSILSPFTQDPPRAVIVISAKKSGFIAGADIKEFTGITDAEAGFRLIHAGQEVLNRLAALRCPTVAAIHGFALGGGLELALACRYRVAVDDEKLSLGLPEVQLGIHPGFGGTVRSVRLIGVRPAMEMMLTGKPVRAEKARRLGLVDKLVPADQLRAAAKEIALQAPTPHRPPFGERVLSWPIVRGFVQGKLEAQVASKARREHYPAPYAIIDLWSRGGNSYEAEARSIAALFLTQTSRSLVRVYLLQDRLKALGGKAGPEVKHVHVVGAGVMGGDIAAWSALRGFTVTLQDRGVEFIEPAIKRAHELFDKRIKDSAKNKAARERLKMDVEGAGAADAEVVIEAIFENLEAKQELYRKTEPAMKPAALLASNTSSIPLDELRTAVAAPARFLGLHYFNPVAQMPLVEIVRQDQLDAANEKRTFAFCKAIDKLPVPVKGTPGFLVNRILMPYLLESMRLFKEGVPGPVIDKAAKKFGMPMGPIELADTVGLDVAASVGKELGEFLGLEIPEGLDDYVAAGKRGKKTGEGLYKWENGKPVKPEVDPNYQAPADLIDRMILPMLNEAVACLHDGVVDDADLLDAGVIFGTGFAPFRGGPIQHVRAEGAAKIRAQLETLAGKYGQRFAPKPGWDDAALVA